MHEVVAFYFLSLFIWFGSCCCCCWPILLTYHSAATNVYRCACARAHFTFFHHIVYHHHTHFYLINNSMKPNRIIQSLYIYVHYSISMNVWQCDERKKGISRGSVSKQNGTHSHTHRNQFFFSGFSTCFYLTCALSFHFQASNATPKGERNEDQQQKQGVDRMLYIARCMVERAHFMSVVLILVLFTIGRASLGWNFKGNEYPRTRYSFVRLCFCVFSLFLAFRACKGMGQ